MRIREIKREIKKQHEVLEVVEKIIDALKDVQPNYRIRVVKAAAILHGVDL